MKNQMRGQVFNTPEEAIRVYKNLVSEVPLEQWSHCFQDWFYQMQKCVNCKEEYLEKQ